MTGNATARLLATSYLDAKGYPGLEDIPEKTGNIVGRGRRIAQAFHNACSTDVETSAQGAAKRVAYRALADESIAQYRIVREYLTITAYDDNDGEPYANSEAMRADVRDNLHLFVYNGGAEHELLTRLQNFKFRAVHDFFGHCLSGAGFGPRGEEIAWRHHKRMFSLYAMRAMTTETRGQNSWVNFGPFGHLPVKERPYAPQRAVLLPGWCSLTNLSG